MSRDFEPTDFGKIAEEIVEKIKNNTPISIQDREEGFLRTAISRAYYCVFLLARERMFVEVQKIPKDETIHREVNLWLCRKIGKRGSDKFSSLRRLRNQADYDLPPIFRADVRVAELALGIARKLMKSIK